jgi:hypothetical protein
MSTNYAIPPYNPTVSEPMSVAVTWNLTVSATCILGMLAGAACAAFVFADRVAWLAAR